MRGEIVLHPGDVVRIGSTILPWQSYFHSAPAGGLDAGRTQMDNRGGNQHIGEAHQNVNHINIVTDSHTSSHVQQPTTSKPNNYLVWAILNIFFCSLPLGIVSVVYASKVDGLWAAGDYAGAERAAGNARLWFWWAFGIGLAFNLIWLIYYFILGAALFAFL